MAVFYDGIHVTDRGSQLYAAYISSKLGILLQKRPQGSKSGANAITQIEYEDWAR